MKHLKLFFFAAMAVLCLAACSGGNKKFDGLWQPIKGSQIDHVRWAWLMSVKTVDDKTSNLVFIKNYPEDTIKLQYDKQLDQLYGYFKGYHNKLIYIKDKDHLLIPPLDDPRSFGIEYERINTDTLKLKKNN